MEKWETSLTAGFLFTGNSTPGYDAVAEPGTNAVEFRHRLHGLLENSIDSYGYELVHLELMGREKSRVLRLYIDAPGGVNLDDCVFVSQQVGRLLDVEDPIEGTYSLEVSSPGIERPLAKREHFEDAIGERIEVATMMKCDGRKRILGQLLDVVNHSVIVESDGVKFTIEMNNIRRARLKPDLDKVL